MGYKAQPNQHLKIIKDRTKISRENNLFDQPYKRFN